MKKAKAVGADLARRLDEDRRAREDYLGRLPMSKNDRLAFLVAYLESKHSTPGSPVSPLVIEAWLAHLDRMRKLSVGSCVATRKQAPTMRTGRT